MFEIKVDDRYSIVEFVLEGLQSCRPHAAAPPPALGRRSQWTRRANVSRNVEVVCDSCQGVCITFGSHEDIDAGLKDAGWSKDSEGRDLCDECSPHSAGADSSG